LECGFGAWDAIEVHCQGAILGRALLAFMREPEDAQRYAFLAWDKALSDKGSAPYLPTSPQKRLGWLASKAGDYATDYGWQLDRVKAEINRRDQDGQPYTDLMPEAQRLIDLVCYPAETESQSTEAMA
jgi:hypothetical protein